MGNSTVVTTTTDRRTILGEGSGLTGLLDSPITATSGATINLSVADPATAREAIQALQVASTEGIQRFSAAVTDLAGKSFAASEKLAKSQEQFVATASGQRWPLYGLVVMVVAVVVAVAIYFWRRRT